MVAVIHAVCRLSSHDAAAVYTVEAKYIIPEAGMLYQVPGTWHETKKSTKTYQEISSSI